MVQITRSEDKDLLDTVKASITDKGLCYTINAKSIKNTFKVEKDQRLNTFANILDRPEVENKPITIRGSGYLQRSIFWLNARGSSNRTRSLKGSLSAAINNWNDYFSVRL